MRQINWTNYAISELKVFSFTIEWLLVIKLQTKFENQFLTHLNRLLKILLLVLLKTNLIYLKQEHPYLVEGNYKSFIKLRKTIFTSLIFLIVDKTLIK